MVKKAVVTTKLAGGPDELTAKVDTLSVQGITDSVAVVTTARDLTRAEVLALGDNAGGAHAGNTPANGEPAGDPSKGSSKKKAEKDPLFDRPDLWPYREKMKTWVEAHLDDLHAFLEYRGAEFKILYGTSFYYQPGTDTISLDVQRFKEALEKTGTSINQVMFVNFHEVAHLKTMLELDRAGKRNMLAQFGYTEGKVIKDKVRPDKYVSLGGTYNFFYNILEDGMVNYLVLNTRLYSSETDSESKRRNEEVKELYTEKFFGLSMEVGEGCGDYIYDAEKRKQNQSPFVYVGEGKGNLVMMKAADYEKGFDYTLAKPELGRAGQLETFFMKNQMIGSKVSDVYHEKNNPEGKFRLHPDVAEVLTRPINEVYRFLLNKINDKYRNDPVQLKRYTDFMKTVLKVPLYEERNGKIVSNKVDLVENVVNPSTIQLDGTVNVARAKIHYDQKLKVVAGKLDLVPEKATFMDIFNKYKSHKRSTRYSWTFPLKHNLSERTMMTRAVLEPIFTMLCILDDSFDVTLPPTSPHGDHASPDSSPSEGQEGAEENTEWKIGDEVINDDETSSNRGRKGIIADIKYSADGKIVSVTVEYYGSSIQNMAQQAVNSEPTFSGEEEEIFNPDLNLKLVAKKSLETEGGKGSKDKRKRHYEDEEDKPKPNPNPNSDPDPDQTSDEANEEPKSDPNPKPLDDKDPGSDPEGSDNEPKDDPSLDDKLDNYSGYLKKLIQDDDRKANLKKLEEARKTVAFRDKKAEAKRAKDLVNKLMQSFGKKKPRKNSAEDRKQKLQLSQETVNKYLELEKQIAPFADKMAAKWLQIVKNITNCIKEVKEKYFRNGKPDFRKLQEHFPAIELGQEIQQKLIYEQIVEKIKVELRPKMFRLILLVDNSGSMLGQLDQVRMAQMLINKSLRSLRILFKDAMKNTLGVDYNSDIDLVCDLQVWTFGKKAKKVKDFAVRDLTFLRDDKISRPQVDEEDEILSALKVFQRIDAEENYTKDLSCWKAIYAAHNGNKQVAEALKGGLMTEVICQFSDGQIDKTEESLLLIEALRSEFLAKSIGLAIGEHGAFDALKARHGENVVAANTPAQIVDQMGVILERIVREQIEKPMEKILRGF